MTPDETLHKHPGGRPRVSIKPQQVSQLRSQGASWREIAKTLGIGTATAMRLFRLNEESRHNIQQVSTKPLMDSGASDRTLKPTNEARAG